jgi:hypothetical protein
MIGNAKEEIQQGPPAFDVLELARASMGSGTDHPPSLERATKDLAAANTDVGP